MAIVTVTSDLGLFHVNEALSQYAQGYAQDADSFIASQVAPVINVDNKSDVYYVGKTEHLQLSDTARAPGSLFPQIECAVSESAYTCKGYGVEVSMGWELPKNADAALDVEQENVTLAVDRLMLNSEYRTMQLMTNNSNFAQTGVADSWTETDVDPYVDIETAKADVVAACGHLPNTIFMNYNTSRVLRNNTLIKERVKYTEAGASPASSRTPLFAASSTSTSSSWPRPSTTPACPVPVRTRAWRSCGLMGTSSWRTSTTASVRCAPRSSLPQGPLCGPRWVAVSPAARTSSTPA